MKTTLVQPTLTNFFQHDVSAGAKKEHDREMKEGTAGFAENGFVFMMEESDESRALDFLRMLPVHMPTGKVFEELVHRILLKSEVHEVVSRCNFYLLNLLQTHPPFNENQEKFYRDNLFSVHKKASMWEVLKRPINCTMRQCGISRSSSCSKSNCNCPVYLRYLVNVIKVNYEELETARYACTNASEPPIPLICYLFWSSGKPDSSSISLHHIVDWIDDLYSIKKSVLQIELLEILFTLLNIAMKCILRHTGCNEVEILGNIHCPSLANILQSLNNCKFILTSRTNLEMFFNSIEDQWLRIKICDALLSYMVYNKLQIFNGRISLRRIVTKYMFSGIEVKKEVEETDKENCSSPPPKKKTKLSTGRRSAVKAEVDIFAQDKHGDTALHIATKNDALEIADLLLVHGGNRLASVKNFKGNVALSLAATNDMKFLYSQAIPVTEPKQEVGSDSTSQEGISCEDLVALHLVACGSDSPVYLICLHTLLTDFVKFFKLDEIGDLPCTNDGVQKHLSECYGFSPNIKDIEAFKDDMLVLKNFPEIVEKFTKLLAMSNDYDNEVDAFVKWLNFFTITLTLDI